MEVTPALKLTQIGPVPLEWEITELQHACREVITYGIEQCGPHIENGVPYIRVSDMDVGELDVEGMLRTSRAIASKFGRSTVEVGDLVYALRSRLGEVRLVTNAVAGANLTQGTARLAPKTHKISSSYLLWAMRSHQSIRQAESEAKGTTFREITLADLRRIAIPIPSVSEQEAISAALDDADALVQSLARLLAKKRDIKLGAMQELLTGKRRLPGFTEDWEDKKLGDIGESLIGLTYSPGEIRPYGTLVLRSANIQNSRLSFDDNIYVDAAVPERIRTRPGDILICVKNGSRDLIGKCALLDKRVEGMTFGAFMAVFRTPSSEFICQQLQSDVIKRQIHKHLGGTINQITNKSLNSFEVSIPPTVSEQSAITTVLSDMDAEIDALEAKLAKARMIKQGVMQELLTGRTRFA